MNILALLILLFILSIFSFFFSASETAIIGLSKIKLRHMIDKGIKKAYSIQHLLTKLDRFIAAILIGNDFVNIAISAIVTAIFVRWFGYHWGVVIATFSSTFFVLIMCEITPKILATKHTEKIAVFTAPFMERFIQLFYPFIFIFTSTGNFILKILRIGPVKRSPLITEEELRTMIEVGKEEGVLSEEARRMLHRIFEFGDTRVVDVMVPKERMIAVNIKVVPQQLLDIFVEEGHARLPVYEESIDNIVGIIYARDLLYTIRDKNLFLTSDLVRPAYYASYKMRVNELLKEFQLKKIQIAIVVDENKKTLGLVTLEDLLEEIVGEIEEEYPTPPF
ncbi:MAG: hemolysin family protein [Candidatus Omnitrophica bacterium]|nr:hemolysin family protein [Candidatus Omnitrophota bacterium]